MQVTQSLGNLVVPQGCKESWMEPLIPFMASKISSIRNFLEDLITINVEDGMLSTTSPSVLFCVSFLVVFGGNWFVFNFQSLLLGAFPSAVPP